MWTWTPKGLGPSSLLTSSLILASNLIFLNYNDSDGSGCLPQYLENNLLTSEITVLILLLPTLLFSVFEEQSKSVQREINAITVKLRKVKRELQPKAKEIKILFHFSLNFKKEST